MSERMRESKVSFIRAIFRGPHLYKDWPAELPWVLQVHFHHSFSYHCLRKEDRIHSYCMRTVTERNIDFVTLAKHTDHQNWS